MGVTLTAAGMYRALYETDVIDLTFLDREARGNFVAFR